MNVEIGTEAAQFPEKEYIKGIFLAVQAPCTDKKNKKIVSCNTKFRRDQVHSHMKEVGLSNM